MFVALKGDTHDGHAHLAQAAAAGAPILVVHDASVVPPAGFDPPCGVLKVADTGKALLKIAQAYRESLKRTKVIAVCGSNGKTTTTRLIDHLLGRTMRGTASEKSFNNHVGVPLTILRARESDQYLVCEVGTNHPGEIAALGAVVRPDIAVITSIGREHLEGLGDLAGVAAEEAAILKALRPGGWAVATADAPELSEHLRGVKNLITFGRAEGATLRLTGVRHVAEAGRVGLAFGVNRRLECRLPLIGAHNALNALAALAVARRLGIDEQKAADALATAGGAEMRLAVEHAGGMTILNDAYNANPDSMIAGIDTLLALRTDAGGPGGLAGLLSGGRCVAVLGEMRELGAASEESHRLVARTLVERDRAGGGGAGGARIDLALLVGEGMKAAADELARAGWDDARVRHFASAEGVLAGQIARLLGPGDLVLVKGSRRVRLERVVEAVKSPPAGEDEEGAMVGALAAPTGARTALVDA
jgi:UDP-N-acetylmuramoyl-tripeptide--D-alanyl-D-alanine ligase